MENVGTMAGTITTAHLCFSIDYRVMEGNIQQVKKVCEYLASIKEAVNNSTGATISMIYCAIKKVRNNTPSKRTEQSIKLHLMTYPPTHVEYF